MMPLQIWLLRERLSDDVLICPTSEKIYCQISDFRYSFPIMSPPTSYIRERMFHDVFIILIDARVT